MKGVGVRRETLVVGKRYDTWGHALDRPGIRASNGGALQKRVGGDARRDLRETARRERRRATNHEVRSAERRVLTDQDFAGID